MDKHIQKTKIREDGMKTKERAHDRIKDLLTVWAAWQNDGFGNGWPRSSAFVNIRVQCDTQTVREMEMPEDVQRLDTEIRKLAPNFVRIVALEYCDRRPQKTKAALLSMPRQVFSARLLWIYEQLTFAMWGIQAEAA